MPFIIKQAVQPGIIMLIMQSQQAWIIFSMFLSPLVHVIMQPMSIISILHMPIMPMLHMQQGTPFIIMQQEHMPPWVIMQSALSISAEVLSSHIQDMHMPPGHFSMVMVQRGAIIMFAIIGLTIGLIIGAIMGDMPIIGLLIMGFMFMPVLDIPVPRSVVIILVIGVLPFFKAGQGRRVYLNEVTTSPPQ